MLTLEHLELPTNETQIEYRQNAGSCELSFYKTIKEITPNSYTEYHYTITYTDFTEDRQLKIYAYNTRDKSDNWFKVIKL